MLQESISPPITKAPEIEDFEIMKPISRGAYGKVFLGFKKNNPDHPYAIKVMKKEEMVHKNMTTQVNRERNALALTRSPYCVQLYYSLQTPSCVFLVMEYLIGGDLKSLLSISGFFPENMAIFYAAEIILALEYLHRHGIIHRDIKPDNMLLTSSGHIRLTDFGLSQVSIHRDLEITDLVNASPDLMTTRTPGQLLSLTSHLSFGSCERLKHGFDNKAILETNLTGEGSSSYSWLNENISGEKEMSLNKSSCSQKTQWNEKVEELEDEEPVNEEKPQSSINSENNSGSSYHTCLECSSDTLPKQSLSPEESSEEEVFKITTVKSSPPMKFSRPRQKTGLTPRFTLLDIEKQLNQSRKRKFNEIETMKTPLRSVLKNRGDSFEYEVPQVMVSTPISSLDKSLPVVKKTRFEIIEKEELINVYDEMSPIHTPQFTGSSVKTPLRTPKSVKGKSSRTSSHKVVGTPDYLAPELLLSSKHGPEVDWWSLGICLYEFMTGVLPFHDDTAEAVFHNILNQDLEWPEGDEALSDLAVEAISTLLTRDPIIRPTEEKVKDFRLFSRVQWDSLYESTAPFIPQPDSIIDTSYFTARNTLQNIQMSGFDL